MKIPALLAACLLPSLLLTTPLRADDASQRAAAEQLLKVMKVEQSVSAQLEQAKGQMAGMLSGASAQAGLKPEQIAQTQKAQADAMTFLQQQLSWNNIKADYVQAYTQTFSEQEMKDLTTYFQQPIGQKYLDKQPQLNSAVGQIMQKRMMELMPQMMQKMSAGAGK